MTKDELVAVEVERWDRTPFVPKQATKGRGVDCRGLLYGIARDLGFPEAANVYALDIGYDLGSRRGLPHARLVEGFDSIFERTDEIVPGGPLLLKWGGLPGHIAIASRREGYAWHAQIEPNAFVKEASQRSLLKMFPLFQAYRWRD